MFIRRRVPLLLLVGLCIAVAARSLAARDRHLSWTGVRNLAGVVDLQGPSATGSIYLEADGRLEVMSAAGAIRPFAPGYRVPAGPGSYLALSSGQAVAGSNCRWPVGDLYALRPSNGGGITAITPRGLGSTFVVLHPKGLERGIAFDLTGRFGHRLLVTATASTGRARRTRRATGETTIYAISCNGSVQVLTQTAPRVDGGVVVAPRNFGRFGGDLLAPDEYSGALYAIAPDGAASPVTRSGPAQGARIGTESLGIVPSSYGRALVADRVTPTNGPPGEDQILSVPRAALSAAGAQPGDLLTVSEAGAQTTVISCTATGCKQRFIGRGPTAAHVEGHLVFSAPG